MESRWYIPKGKTLENTKIEERGHALHLTQKSWNNVCTHLDRNRLLQESIEREEQYKKAMKLSSLDMTKNWENSVENIRRRQEESRETQLNQSEDRNHLKFLEMKKKDEEDQKIYISKMREKMARRKDYPKALESALILSKVVYEREKQKEFQKEIKEHERQIEANFAEIIRKDVQNEKEIQEVNLRNLADKRKAYAEELKERINENNLLKEKERKEKIENELREYDLSRTEMETTTKCKQEKELEKRARFKHDLDKNMEDLKIQQERKNQEELELNDVLQVINKCNTKLECMKKQKAAEIVHKRSQVAEEASKRLALIENEREMKEEEIYKRAVAEKIAIDEEKKLIELNKKLKFKEEKINDFLKFQENEKQRLLREKEISKWHLLNRLKQTEENVNYENSLKIKNKAISFEFRKELEKQIKDMINNDEKEESKRELERIVLANKEEDGEFLSYAKQVYNYVQQNGWPVYAIEKIIQKYKKNVLNDFTSENECDS